MTSVKSLSALIARIGPTSWLETCVPGALVRKAASRKVEPGDHIRAVRRSMESAARGVKNAKAAKAAKNGRRVEGY
jgi:hypothetical protein